MKHKRKRAKRASGMYCPYCGSPVVLRSAEGIYRDNYNNTMLYVCSRYPECDSYVRTHPGTLIPVGTLANKDLRALRKEAHYYFDQLFQKGVMSKQEAYVWLAGLLQAPISHAHIGYLGDYYCKEVIRESQNLLRQRHVDISYMPSLGSGDIAS